jgi:hypothetical protein
MRSGHRDEAAVGGARGELACPRFRGDLVLLTTEHEHGAANAPYGVFEVVAQVHRHQVA